ncbi:hypothetical protein BDD12DRAFT_979855 [Trichophaea hybrida]|nr:hypothetical protein BDD12DRAFT_979855 [Trichophaea hybrida]
MNPVTKGRIRLTTTTLSLPNPTLFPVPSPEMADLKTSGHRSGASTPQTYDFNTYTPASTSNVSAEDVEGTPLRPEEYPFNRRCHIHQLAKPEQHTVHHPNNKVNLGRRYYRCPKCHPKGKGTINFLSWGLARGGGGESVV